MGKATHAITGMDACLFVCFTVSEEGNTILNFSVSKGSVLAQQILLEPSKKIRPCLTLHLWKVTLKLLLFMHF